MPGAQTVSGPLAPLLGRVEPSAGYPDGTDPVAGGVEALLLSADGMRVPHLARHFDYSQATVRRWLHQFAPEGFNCATNGGDWTRMWRGGRLCASPSTGYCRRNGPGCRPQLAEGPGYEGVAHEVAHGPQ